MTRTDLTTTINGRLMVKSSKSQTDWTQQCVAVAPDPDSIGIADTVTSPSSGLVLDFGPTEFCSLMRALR